LRRQRKTASIDNAHENAHILQSIHKLPVSIRSFTVIYVVVSHSAHADDVIAPQAFTGCCIVTQNKGMIVAVIDNILCAS